MPLVAPSTARTTPTQSAVRHYLGVADLDRTEVATLLRSAADLKRQGPAGGAGGLQARTAALLFQKPSLRTRVSFEVAMLQMGGHALYLSPAEVQLGEREIVSDAAQVLSRYVDVIVARVYLDQDVRELARHAAVPVINALSDREHPCQLLADLLTLAELHAGPLADVRLAYVGDGNNVANSLAWGAARTGMDLRFACPQGYEPDPAIVTQAQQAGARITLFTDPRAAVADADAVYTDAWYSMGQEDQAAARVPAFRPYQVNEQLLAYAAPDVRVLHCLPAHRNQEITDRVLDGPASVVFDQAENRLHVQKALLLYLFGVG